MDADTNVTVATIIAVLAILFVGSRFYIRRPKKSGLKLDDWLILVSLLVDAYILTINSTIATDILAICGSYQILTKVGNYSHQCKPQWA